MADDKPKFRIVDDPTVHEVYANQFVSASFNGRSFSITLGTSRPLPETTGEASSEETRPRFYVLEIAASAAVDFITSVSGMLNEIGLLRKAETPTTRKFQGDVWGR